MSDSANSVNLSWTFWVLILIGNGVIMALITMLQQFIFHKQSLNLEEKKRADYLIFKNYDLLFEVAKILNQIILTWWQIASRSEEKKEKAEISLWDYDCPMHEGFKTERIQYASFIKQYNYLVPREVSDKINEANEEYKKDSFNKAQDLIIEAEVALNNLIGIKKSQEEIKKRFEIISKSG